MVKLTKRNYVNRDVSWMYFNHRILEEAQREDIPVLERMSFLGIYSNNLDEFFRVRMANLGRIVNIDSANRKDLKAEVNNAQELIKNINRLNAKYSKEYAETVADVTRCLAEKGIRIVNEKEIDDEQREFVHTFYRQKMMGRISPVWFENIKHFEHGADDKIYMIVRMSKGGKKPYRYALFLLPVEETGRWVKLPPRQAQNKVEVDSQMIMYIDDAIRVCLPRVFPGMPYDVYDAWTFKFTRDAEMDIDNDLREGLLQKIQKGLKSRKAGVPIRIVYDCEMPEGVLRRLKSKLADNGKLDTAVAGGRYQNHRDMMSLPDCGIEGLRYPKWSSVFNEDQHCNESTIKTIREKDRMLHVPYHI